ncbi:MAG: hypothetical protein AAGG68_14780 [Bacteroidota bacterium]
MKKNQQSIGRIKRKYRNGKLVSTTETMYSNIINQRFLFLPTKSQGELVKDFGDRLRLSSTHDRKTLRELFVEHNPMCVVNRVGVEVVSCRVDDPDGTFRRVVEGCFDT